MSYELHDQVLGMVLSQPKRYWPFVKDRWQPEVFLEISRIKIAAAIKELIDSETELSQPILTAKTGGESGLFIQRLKSSYIPETNIDWYMNQIVGWYNLKQMASDIGAMANDITIANYTDKIDKMILRSKDIHEKIERCFVGRDKLANMEQMVISTTDRLEKLIESKMNGKQRGVSIGMNKLDSYISGLIPGRFYIIAARTSVGKTSFATWMALQAIKQGSKPLFFSNEMDKEDIIEKFIATESKIGTHKFQTGDMTDGELTKFVESAKDLSKLKMAIDEKSGWDIDALTSRVYQMHREGRCDMVFVDYLQQVRVKSSKSKYEQVSHVSDAMKKLSRELNIPVIGLAQINRESEKGGKEDIPSLAQLKDSGSLEQDADVVMILHKRDIADQEVILSISKNRYGMTGAMKLKHIHQFNIYESLV
jgi:replicative DNA helicase